MVVRGGGDVAGHPGAGLQEGGQVGSVQAGRQHAAAVEGVGPGGWVKGPEGVRVGIGPENAAQGLAGVSDEAWCAVQRLLYAVEVSNQDWGDGGVQVRPESVEVGCEVIGLCMDVEERKGTNSDQLDPPRLDLLNSGRQAGQGGDDEVLGGLPEGGGREGVAKGGCQGRNSIVGVNFLKENQVRLGLLEDGVEAAEVGPLVGVEGEDG